MAEMELIIRTRIVRLVATLLLLSLSANAQTSRPSSAHTKSQAATSELDLGSVTNGVYRNQMLAFSCKIPAGWVLRTDEMNTHEPKAGSTTAAEKTSPTGESSAKVLLAAFSRPPEAHGEDVNSAILIAAESQSAYPGLKEAAQYFGPLTEVAKAQGFSVDEEPYETTVGARTLVQADFHKDVGSRVMHQSTLAMLENGYAVSITVIGGTEDEVEELIEGLQFEAPARPEHRSK